MKKLAKKVDRSTLSSISTPPSNVKALATYAANYFFIFKELLQRYVPSISSIPLLQGMTWDPTWKATPSKMKPIRLKGSRRKKGVPSVFRLLNPFKVGFNLLSLGISSVGVNKLIG